MEICDTHTDILTCIHAYIHTYTHTHTYTHIHTHTLQLPVPDHVGGLLGLDLISRLGLCMFSFKGSKAVFAQANDAKKKGTYVCMYVCALLTSGIHIHVGVGVCMYVCFKGSSAVFAQANDAKTKGTYLISRLGLCVFSFKGSKTVFAQSNDAKKKGTHVYVCMCVYVCMYVCDLL
jgi:amino acid permease